MADTLVITTGGATVVSDTEYGSPAQKDAELDNKFVKIMLEIEKRY